MTTIFFELKVWSIEMDLMHTVTALWCGAAVSSALHGVGTVSRIQTMRRSKNDAQPLHVLAIAMPISHITR